MVVTNKKVLGTSIEALHLGERYGATITRVTRGDLEIASAPELRLQFGDIVQVVADEGDVGKVVAVLGNRFSALNETNFLPIFVGIVLGVLAGTLPIEIPGLPLPLRMGIAGGPLVLAIVLSRIGRIGPLIWYRYRVSFQEKQGRIHRRARAGERPGHGRSDRRQSQREVPQDRARSHRDGLHRAIDSGS
jgi:uncharacterized transporter YbjL